MQATVTYLPASGVPIVRQVTIPAGQRMTRNIAAEDRALASAAVGTRIAADRPIIVERAQYWPNPASVWYEAHNSFGLTETGTRWGLAEGRVGGPTDDQTYALLANPDTTPATVNLTFLRTNGTTVRKTFALAGTSRLTVSIAGPGSHVPELANAEFGAVIESTEPIAVERSLYSSANGVIWSAGTNATATPLPPPLTVTVTATDSDASENGPDAGTFTFSRNGWNPSSPATVHFTIGGSAQNSSDYSTISAAVTIPANQTSVTRTITPSRDNLIEGAETVAVTITPNASYAIGSPNSTIVPIADSVAAVSVTATDPDAAEAGPDLGTFTFTRTNAGNVAAPLVVNFTLGGTAANGVDYLNVPLSVTIPPNQTSVTRTITPRVDVVDESEETVIVTINASTTYTVGAPNSATVTIHEVP